MAIQPQRNILSVLFDSIFGGRNFTSTVLPYGNYSGSSKYYVTRDNPIVTNPWGVTAYARPDRQFGINQTIITIQPGQSYNYVTGQLSDPNLHANTAKRLNEATNFREVNQAGLQQASASSARQTQSVLATLDQMYFANVNTQADNGTAPLSQTAQVNEVGINTGANRTILGADTSKKKPAPQTALKRALT